MQNHIGPWENSVDKKRQRNVTGVTKLVIRNMRGKKSSRNNVVCVLFAGIYHCLTLGWSSARLEMSFYMVDLYSGFNGIVTGRKMRHAVRGFLRYLRMQKKDSCSF